MTANTVERSDFLSYRRLVKCRVLCKVASRCARANARIPRAARRAYDAIGSAPDHLSSSRRVSMQFPRLRANASRAHARMRSGCRDATRRAPRAGEFLLRACALDTRYTRVPARREPARRRGPRGRDRERWISRNGGARDMAFFPLGSPSHFLRPVRARGENVTTALFVITIINR